VDTERLEALIAKLATGERLLTARSRQYHEGEGVVITPRRAISFPLLRVTEVS
jgi:hypothetical protein